ncbi:MAG: sugar phosphate nucleotidyltransferase [Syntrophobacteria bacterium]
MPSKAIIPAAGLGTRVRPIAGDLPKELLPVAGKPLLVHAVEGLAAAGIRRIAVVISPAKETIREFVLGHPTGFPALRVDGHLRVLLRSCQFTFFYQPRPSGVADAIALCKEFVGNEPFALVMPDNVLLDGAPVMAQLLPFFSRYPQDMTGAVSLGSDKASSFGNVGLLDSEPLPAESPRLMRVRHFSDKKKEPLRVPEGTRVLKVFGGGIYLPHYLDFIEQCRLVAAGELDDVPVVQAVAREKGLLSVALEGDAFDVGNPDGYRAANLYAEKMGLLRRSG